MEAGWTDGTRQVNGLSLHVVEAGPADGPLLILLHGFSEFWWGWRHQITPLAEQGYRVVVPDMRGYRLTTMLNYYRALRERKVPDRPSRIAPPTLILWGEKDSFLEHHLARAALDLCEDGRLSIVERATHWLHIEEPARVNAEIIRFLGGRDWDGPGS